MRVKRYLIIGALLMSICNIGLTSCSSEDLLNDSPTQDEQNQSDNESDDSQDNNSGSGDSDNTEDQKLEIPEGYVRMTFTSSSNNRQSRVSVVEDPNTSGKLRWDSGDQVTIMTGSDMNNLEKCTFTTEKGGIGSAFFEYVGPSVDTKTYFGIHNATYYKDGSQIRFIIPTGNGDTPLCQTEKNSSIHLNKFRPMYTDIQVSNENINELTGLYFKHLSSLLYFNIINQSGKAVTINSIKTKVLSGTPFYNEGVRLTADIGQSRSENSHLSKELKRSDFILLNLGENGSGLKSEIGETFQAYQSLLPVEFPNNNPTQIQFILNIDGKDIESLTLESTKVRKFEAGKYYKINLRINENETIDIIEVETGIEEWENGGNIIIPV